MYKIKCPKCGNILNLTDKDIASLGTLYHEEDVGSIAITAILCSRCGARITLEEIQKQLDAKENKNEEE